MWHPDVLGTIGNTPLVRLNRIVGDLPCTVLAKVEFFNPGGSVKDRIGVSMIEAAERDGRLKPGGTIIEGTSGNTGAGLAIAGIAKGYRCIFTTTDKQSQEKIDVLRAFGAEVLVCPTNVAPDDPRSYYQVARRLARETPNSVYLNQYDNPANAEAHYETTGPELWEQTDGKITHYVAGAGTGGTISGTAKYLKEQNPDVQVIGVDPFGSVYHKYFYTREFDEKEIYPYLTEGVGEDILAENMAFDLVDHYVRVTDKASMQMTRRLAREEGLFTGQSCGMAAAGALEWLRAHKDELSEDDIVVVVLPDSGFRYLSKTYNDTWMQQHGFLGREDELTAADVLTLRRGVAEVIGASPDDTLGEAIAAMSERGISQMPVVEADGFVGSLSERGILARLMRDPEAREASVRDAMEAPFPVVQPDAYVDELSEHLERDHAAVLVPQSGGEGPGSFDIITRADLISAFARARRG